MTAVAPVAARRRLPWLLVVVGASLVVGVAVRAWMFRTQVSPTESDEAVLALIALRLTRGHVDLMYWGQPYGGPVESVLAAPLLLVLGPSVLATKLVGTGLCLGSSVLLWRIGRRTVGDTAGALAGAIFWVWPPYFVFYSTKMSIYFGSLFLALLTVHLLVRLALDDVPPRWLGPATGIAAGAAFWASPQTLFLLLPVGVSLLPRLFPRWRRALVVAPFVLVGASPWLLHNATHGWASLRSVPVDQHVGYLARVAGVPAQVPLALGLRTFGTERWLWRPLALTVLAVGMAGLLLVLARRPRWAFLGWALLLFPLAYAMSPLSVYSRGGSPRYFLMAMPVVALLLGRLLADVAQRLHPTMIVVPLVAILAVTAINLRDLSAHRLGWFPGAPDAMVPPEFGDLLRLFEEHDVAYAYADYWVSFRATFEAGEDPIVAPVQPWLDRFPPYSAAVASSPSPAFVTLRPSAVTARVQEQLASMAIPFDVWARGDFVVIQPERHVDREAMTDAYQLAP